jgi:hypothetical protein
MLVRFWGTRGSLAVAQTAGAIKGKIARALVAAGGRSFADEAEAGPLSTGELELRRPVGTYGGATTCLEIEGGDDSFLHRLRHGVGPARVRHRCLPALTRRAGMSGPINFFMSHLHWDHIMGFPFFGPAFDPGAHIVIHSGHADAEQALRRQQEEISFPVAFDWLRAKIEFRTLLSPGESYRIDGHRRRTDAAGPQPQVLCYGSSPRCRQDRVFSTDSRAQDRHGGRGRQVAFDFFAMPISSSATPCTRSPKHHDEGGLGPFEQHHGGQPVPRAGAKRLALFHHEPIYSDDDIQRMHKESIRYEELTRRELPLEVLCAYDGLEVRL